jgi:hypothetical protein
MATVQVFTRRLYGKPRIYPANELASTLVLLTQRPTFTPEDVAIIEQLGYTVERVRDPREAEEGGILAGAMLAQREVPDGQ